ncbi:hypothetical protein F2Q70_00016830 [Brassica cretica]|uniref:Uncharacterized protein n=1 Tax=Brassica cretica TaxID=69181 RepID=A0A8S9I340_BRACR|nr:hypothetical protein F2Q70_00016830 [Brassica cretica]
MVYHKSSRILFRHLIAFLVRAREEGLSFSLGHHVIEDIPYRDAKWHEQFFVFKVDQASVGNFEIVGGSEDETEHSRDVIASPSVHAQFSDRLVRQLVRRSSFRASGSASRSRASDSPPLIPIRDSDDEGASEERWSPISLSPGSEDETAAATR